MLDYLPAISIDLSLVKSIKERNKNNEIEKFFEDIFKLKNRYLISYGISHNVKDIREYYKINWILGDSGGFQLVQKMFKRPDMIVDHITPDKVLHWLEQECNAGMNLDLPPFIASSNYDSVYDDCLKRSLENFKYFEKNRKNKNLILYNIVHGRDFDHIDKWYHSVKDFNFEGWALSLFPTTDPLFLSLQMIYMDEVLKKSNKKIEDYPFHILGATSVNNILMLLYFNVYRNINLITIDSSTHAIGARFRVIIRNNSSIFIDESILAPTVTRGYKFLEGIDLNNIDDAKNQIGYNEYIDFCNSGHKMPCNCYSCNLWNNANGKENIELLPSTFSELLNWHNISCMNDVVLKYNTMFINNKSYFKKYVEEVAIKNQSNRFKDSIDVIKFYFENNISFKKLLTKYEGKVNQIVSNIEEKNSTYEEIDFYV